MFRCLLCHTTDRMTPVAQHIRDDKTGEHKVVQCLSCGHLQLHPLPLPEDNRLFYDADRQSLNLIKQADYDLLKQKTRVDTERRVRWINETIEPQSRVLDLGCGYGFFVDLLSEEGHGCTGMDISLDRLAFAKKHMRGNFIRGILDTPFLSEHAASFDALTLFHVLEHVEEPALFLTQCLALLKPQGKLFIEVPNGDDQLLQQIPEYSRFYWQRAHLSYFSPKHLQLVVKQASGLDILVQGVQRYGIENLWHWSHEGTPQLNNPNFFTQIPALQEIENMYRNEREKRLRCDTLITTFAKPG